MDAKQLKRANQKLLKRRQQEVKPPPKPLGQPTKRDCEPTLSAKESAVEETLTWRCDFCGNAVPPLRLTMGERVRFARKSYCDCPEAQAAKHKLDQEERRQEQQRRAELLIRAAGLNIGKRERMRFSTWDPTRNPDGEQVMRLVLEYIDAVTQPGEGNWLSMHGSYGLGKTHLAVAAMRRITQQYLWTPHVAVWPEHCALVQQSWQRDNSMTLSEARLWGQLKTAGILLLDDLDKRQPTPWTMDKLYEVIDYRYLREKPTIITANHSLLELSDLWSQKSAEVRDSGAAIISRIAGQLWATIEFSGQDQRLA